MSLKSSHVGGAATMQEGRRSDGYPEGGAGVLERLAAPAESLLPLPRLLVIFAHPDDEVLAAGGRLERLRESRLLCVTDGAPVDGADARAHGFATIEAYRVARRAELIASLKLGGISADCAEPLRLAGPDGSCREIADQIADQGAAFHLAELTRAVAREIEVFRPEAVLTHPYEGGHPDHDSCAFAVHSAVRLLGNTSRPIILEAPFYHAGAGGMETGSFLGESAESEDKLSSLWVCELSPLEQARKRERLGCFASQRETLAQFRTEREQFRVAPRYDFCEPPHAGRLLYEDFAWGVSGEQFRALAASAFEQLGLVRESGGSGRE